MIESFFKKARLFRAWTGGHPIWCAWQVTYRCNFRCAFCGYWHDPLGEKAEPPVEQYELGARKLASFGSLLVSLAGGEPFLRTDLPRIVRAVAQYHLPFVTTNGWFVTEELAREVMAAGCWGVSVSVDYADPKKHDAKRGMDGAWNQAWRAVEMLSAARKYDYQRVNVMAVLMNDNLDDLDALARMALQRGAYFMVQPYGYLKTGSRAHGHDDGAVSQRLLELHEKHRNFLSNRYYLQRFDEFLRGGVPGCRAGRAFFNIDSTGDVAICVERKTNPVANLFTDAPQTIRRRLRRAAGSNSCQACWYNCRGEIENLYRPLGLLQQLPTFFFDRGQASGKMGRWR